jgi:hypothetical protein
VISAIFFLRVVLGFLRGGLGFLELLIMITLVFCHLLFELMRFLHVRDLLTVCVMCLL